MKSFDQQKKELHYPIVGMGTFDGVHLGHQKLLNKINQRALETGGESVIITYYHHPLETIHKKTFPYLLTDRVHKERLIRALGIDEILYLDFDHEMANMSAEDFLTKIILEKIGAKELVVGYDTHFGRFREGNYRFLKENADRYQYQVTLVQPFKINNRIISSSLIRDFVREGDMIDAARCLGRNYSINGKVIEGMKLGRDLGFPTINLEQSDTNILLPALGVYCCQVVWDEQMFMGVTNIGYSPTLKKNNYKEIETFILDFDKVLYKQNVEIIFYRKLRDELFFQSSRELKQQIEKDVIVTREFFSKAR
jgi:riboflavin kinase/FMN adenylyltransferase